jgi:uncharacterized BrkB/YihY/UPF0761 family membrane protein
LLSLHLISVADITTQNWQKSSEMTNSPTTLLLASAPLCVFFVALGVSCLAIGTELIRLAVDYKSHYSEKTIERFTRVALDGCAICTVLVACVAASSAWLCFIDQNFVVL